MTHDPVLIAYTAKRGKNNRVYWSRIGHADPHDIGAGLTITLDALPINGRIILLEPDADDHTRALRQLMRASQPIEE
ncbi:MAG: hypothetical protein B7Y80_17660 [Hyphomicrobium sp. 32-62-53]|jgi:hypothetical protein|nr:MAG: hypothetical protein B7Z29_17145 [Hyphomicrobium sp. 12-62-95]OYX97976.1 MAG: hypothetical protein B7Y80_17660 [Hyphomicrobium sp. 32-62-53]